MEAKRRSTIVESLNEKFAFLIKNFNIKETYAKIVTWKPYKALSCFVYDWSYMPLKRGQLELEQPMSQKPTKKFQKKCDANNHKM